MKRKCFLTLIFLLPVMNLMAVFYENKGPQELHQEAVAAYQHKQWRQVAQKARIVVSDYADSPFVSDLYFYGGVAYYHLKDYDLANQMLSTFLEQYTTPKFFEEAVEYKFYIAEKLYNGARVHMFGMESMPKWTSAAREEAEEIFDEVIQTLPRHEITSKALFYKASIQKEQDKGNEAIETYQTLIRRFPKHHLGPDSYVAIAELYLDQASLKFPNPNIMDLAKMNYKKFVYDYPGEERIEEVKLILAKIVDRYAEDLWNSALYYDKRRKISSAVLYYQSILNTYPESHYAHDAMKRLVELKSAYPNEKIDVETYLNIES